MLGPWGSFWKTDLDARRRRAPPGAPVAPHHREARRAADDQAQARSHRRGHRRRHRCSAAAATWWRDVVKAVAEVARGAAWRASCARMASPRCRSRRASCGPRRCSQHFGVTEANWRDAGKKDPNFLESESPLFVGRAVAALAADPRRARAHRATSQLVGARTRVRLHRRRRPAPGLGRALRQDRVDAGFLRAVPPACRVSRRHAQAREGLPRRRGRGECRGASTEGRTQEPRGRGWHEHVA